MLERIKRLGIEAEIHEIAERGERESMVYGDGVYRVEVEHVRAALAHRVRGKDFGFCVQLLRCHGEKRLGIELPLVKEGEELGDLQIAFAMEGQQGLLENVKSENGNPPDWFRRGLADCSWDKSDEVKPGGGGWKEILCQLSLRLREVRATIQGEEWFFYFPVTLLCFLPNSRPFRVLQPASREEIEEGTPRMTPKWLSRRFLSLHWSRKAKQKSAAQSRSEGNGREDQNMGGGQDVLGEDTTGWEAYYEDLEAPYPVDFIMKPGKDGTTLAPEAVWNSRKIFIYYQRVSSGKPWYDNLLCWKYHQWWAKVTRQSMTE